MANSAPLRERNRQLARDTVLDAAERLLQKSDEADFSMRALAAEAGVGFATPFNHFGNKNAIMQALSCRLIETMATRFREQSIDGDAITRVLAMGRISVALLLEKPELHKALIASLAVVNQTPGAAMHNSIRLWSLALGDFSGIKVGMRSIAELALAEQLAFSFRGCISFWTAGELADEKLDDAFRVGVCSLLLGLAERQHHDYLMAQVKSHQQSTH